MSWLCVLALVSGCGRYGFATGSDAVSARDAAIADAMDPSLLVYLPLEEPAGSAIFLDASGHHNDARCIAGSTCPTMVGGKIGSALQFNGTTQYATIMHTAELDTPQAFTLSAWLYVDDLSTDRVPIGRAMGSATTDSIALVTWRTMTCLETSLIGEVREDTCSPFVIPVAQWHHIAGVWDGAFKSIWVDGVRLAQLAGNAVAFDGHDLVIGADMNAGAPAYMWQGRIDEVRFYGRALDAAEIQALSAQ